MSEGERQYKKRKSDYIKTNTERAKKIILLASPNFLAVFMQILTNSADMIWLGRLGVDALGGVAIVYPFFSVMQMMSAGGVGIGVASAVANLKGKGDELISIVPVIFFIVMLFSGLISITFLTFGKEIYSVLGGEGETLDIAQSYSNIVFGGAAFFWFFNLMANVLRGSGDTFRPALILFLGGALHLVLSPILAFGYGNIPGYGALGPAISILFYHVLGSIIVFIFVFSRSDFRPIKSELKAFLRLMKDILRVGVVAALDSVFSYGRYAVLVAMAGVSSLNLAQSYGLIARIDFLIVPIIFSIGHAIIVLVGTNIGANNKNEALKVTIMACFISLTITGGIAMAIKFGGYKAFMLMINDEKIVNSILGYFDLATPFYFLFGAGLALHYACLSAGYVMWPLVANAVRFLFIIGFGGWGILHERIGAHWINLTVVLGLLVHFIIILYGTFQSFYYVEKTSISKHNDQAEEI